MAKLSIKKGDTVLVIAGKDKGKTAEVLECFPQENKVTVKGINVLVKHNKPRSAQDKGGIVKVEGKIPASKVMVVCPVCNKATRVAVKVEGDNKTRVCKKCGASLETAKKAATKKATKATEAVKEEKPAAKKAAAKKAAPAKTAEKKTTAKKAEAKVEKETKAVKPAAEKKPAAKKATTAKKEK